MKATPNSHNGNELKRRLSRKNQEAHDKNRLVKYEWEREKAKKVRNFLADGTDPERASGLILRLWPELRKLDHSKRKPETLVRRRRERRRERESFAKAYRLSQHKA